MLAANPLIQVTPGLMIWTIVCFLVVLFVLKRYAFGPVQLMIDTRRERIQSAIDEADQARAEARDKISNGATTSRVFATSSGVVLLTELERLTKSDVANGVPSGVMQQLKQQEEHHSDEELVPPLKPNGGMVRDVN